MRLIRAEGNCHVEWMEKLKNGLERAEEEGIEALASVQAEAISFFDRLKQHLAENPEPVFAILRRVKPVLIFRNTALVTRFEDVQEVLSRDNVFQVTYKEKMEVIGDGANFFLGMQNSPEYERDQSHMRTVIRRQDLPQLLEQFVAKTAESLVGASAGSVDVVRQLGRVVPMRWIAAYFGCPATSEEDLASWSTVMFRYLFADQDNDPAVGAAAREAATKARAWLDEIIAGRKNLGSQPDDIVGRSLSLQEAGVPGMDNLGIRNNLLGLIIGAIPTTSKCCAQALDELLKRPAKLEEAQEAARSDNDVLVAQYVFEALRFHPNNPGLFRIAAEEYTVAKDKIHATTIPRGATVIAATQSAMFDERMVDAPNEFRTGRPDYTYMHFGYGLHTCFGQYINRVQIPGILKPLLKRKGLRRAEGDAGQIQYEGPFPRSLAVKFD
jgi:cytochrome P450